MLLLVPLLVVVTVNMFVNHGEEELEEGLKARKMVKAMKTKTKAYARATLLLVLRWAFKCEIKVPPLMGAYFVISAMLWAVSSCAVVCNSKKIMMEFFGVRHRDCVGRSEES